MAEKLHYEKGQGVDVLQRLVDETFLRGFLICFNVAVFLLQLIRR